jgi:hypothetical protein
VVSRTAAPAVTLRILGRPLTFHSTSRIEACKPPHVPVPKPGPCPGPRKAGSAVKKATRAVAKPKRAAGRRISGKDLSGQLDYTAIAAQPVAYHKDFDRSDQQLVTITKQQGFDGTPLKGSNAELDVLIAAGGTELWRGVSHQRDDQNRIRKRAPTLVKQFRDGDAYYGVGDFGSGIYFSQDQTDTSQYAADGESGVIRAVLSPDARIADYQAAFDGAAREGNATERDTRQRQLFQDLKGKPLPEKRAIRRAYNDWLETRPAREKVLGDMGRWAAAHGYDAIRVTDTFPLGHTYVVVLNRTALTTTA